MVGVKQFDRNAAAFFDRQGEQNSVPIIVASPKSCIYDQNQRTDGQSNPIFSTHNTFLHAGSSACSEMFCVKVRDTVVPRVVQENALIAAVLLFFLRMHPSAEVSVTSEEN